MRYRCSGLVDRFEHQEALAVVRNMRLEQERHNAQAQCQLLEQQIIRVREEVERIARQLIEEPRTPQPEPAAEEGTEAESASERV